MRTTIDLPADIHQLAANIARDKRQSLSQAVTDLIRRGIEPRTEPSLSVSPVTGLTVIDLGRPITTEDVRSLDDEG